MQEKSMTNRVLEKTVNRIFVWDRVSNLNTFFLILGSAVVLGTASVHAQDPLGEPAEASAMTPDSLTVGSQSMDSHMATSQNPDDLVVDSHPLPAPTEAQEPTTLSGMGVSPDSQPGTAYRLSNLPDANTVRQEVHQQTWDSVQDAQPSMAPPSDLSEARVALSGARSRLEQANAAVGKMIRRDYPTGEPRLRLYDEQKTAQRQVSQAEQWVQNFGGSVNEDSMP
ncbi:MAG: hypothetical protein VX252_09930 [Myxococcota bacterium]|nr:hypothetical protein [Myxococcota bacterium]